MLENKRGETMVIQKEEKKTRIYQIWRLMVGRCHNENWNNYYTRTYYREKGIKVCDEWRYNYFSFKEWALENGYIESLSIDRIDPDRDYTPDNCRWIPLSENRNRAQKGNKRNGAGTKGNFMVVKGDKHCEYWRRFVKVIRTGMSKSAARKYAEEMRTIDPYEHQYCVYVTDGHKDGETVAEAKLRSFLSRQKYI